MGEEVPSAKKRVAVESLGWITESSIMPRKHRAIEGESKRQRKEPIHSADRNYAQQLEVHRAKSSSQLTIPSPIRIPADKLELKAVRDGSARYAALEKKAELYDKLVRGELSDEEENEKYCVDFFRKGHSHDESLMPRGNNTSVEPRYKDDYDGDDLLSNGSKAPGLGRTSATVDWSEHKYFVLEVHEEANEAREKVSELKIRRQEQVAARREKLKQAYLRKQLEKLKASKAEQNPSGV
ncbi:hypothetical protein ACJIZ3_014762 [Penstemon smallii]|uniref:Uncharacterized protein n=1 Tax=Penstemon smallii TaxID=265156 RepID=A0ABD3R418_9LAMI